MTPALHTAYRGVLLVCTAAALALFRHRRGWPRSLNDWLWTLLPLGLLGILLWRSVK